MEKPSGQLYRCHCALFYVDAPLAQVQGEDILSSGLFAQLAADKQHSRFVDTQHWLSRRDTVLSLLSWQLFNTYSRRVEDADGADFTLQALVLGALIRFGVEGARVVEALSVRVEALKALTESIALQVPAPADTPPQTMINLQMAVVNTLGVMRWVSIHFTTQQPLGADLIHQCFHRQHLTSALEVSWCEAGLNERMFADARAAVLSQLGAKKALLIKEVTADA